MNFGIVDPGNIEKHTVTTNPGVMQNFIFVLTQAYGHDHAIHISTLKS